MQANRWALAGVAAALLLTTSGIAAAQNLPMGPTHKSGDSVTGAFEGWFPNQDGTYSILVGYFNRNLDQSVDIPIGPNNSIMPGGPDMGQPTHFEAGRGWGLFTIKVPKDFGDKKLTWTLTVNGVTTSSPVDLNPLWRIAPYIDATGDTPAYIGFVEGGPYVNGPIGNSTTLSATVGTPLTLDAWVADDGKLDPLPDTPPTGNVPGERRKKEPVTVDWTLYRGPAPVKFANAQPVSEKMAQLQNAPPGTVYFGKTTTSVTFSQPGQYILSIQAWDSTGVGAHGFQCCYTDAKVTVNVK